MKWDHGVKSPRDALFAVMFGIVAVLAVAKLGSLLWEIHRHDDWAILWTPPESMPWP